MNKKVCVILLNYNQNRYTIDCVKSLLNSDYPNFMVLLIDNGSTAENYLDLKEGIDNINSDKVVLYRINENCGYVGGINTGLGIVKAYNPHYVLIMNNDTLIDKNAITNLAKTCADYQDKAIVSGKVYHFDETNRLQYIGFNLANRTYLKFKTIGLNEIDAGQYDSVAEMDLLDDIFWLFNINLYDEIGGYNPYFWFNSEQADFALRAKKRGYKLIYTPAAKLWHKGSITIGGRDNNPRLVYWHIQSTLIFHFLHLSFWRFILFYFSVVSNIAISFLKVLIRHNNRSINLTNANAKLKALHYFNKWFFIRNINNGGNPYN